MKADIQLTVDSESPKFIEVSPGLIAAALQMDGELFIRAQLDPTKSNLNWESAWPEVLDRFGVEGYNSEARIFELEDGTEMRQLFLGKV